MQRECCTSGRVRFEADGPSRMTAAAPPRADEICRTLAHCFALTAPKEVLTDGKAPKLPLSLFKQGSETPTPRIIREFVRGRLLDHGRSHAMGSVNKYDYKSSTNENYAVPAGDAAGAPSGEFASLRARLDTAYHGFYTQERQLLQDGLIRETLTTGHRSEEPWVIFTAGPMGAGKSHTIQWLHDTGHFRLQRIVHCDADIFKAALPEWPEYVARDRLTAGAHCQRESGMLVELATEAALSASMHCWIDGSLKDGAWYRTYIEDIRVRYPHYSMAIVEVHAETAVIMRRVSRRATATGRDIPQADILESIRRVPQAVSELSDLVDFYARIENSAEVGTPRLTKYCDRESCYLMGTREEVEKGWAEIRRRFGSESPTARRESAAAERWQLPQLGK